jgi:hypothetical protein
MTPERILSHDPHMLTRAQRDGIGSVFDLGPGRQARENCISE